MIDLAGSRDHSRHGITKKWVRIQA